MKRIFMCLLLIAMASAYAGDIKTINRYGFAGLNKTQSAQSLGHSKLSFSMLLDATNDVSMFEDRSGLRQFSEGLVNTNNNTSATSNAYIDDFMGVNGYVSFGIGISNYFDVGATLPLYYERFTAVSDNNPISGTNVGNIGNLKANIKLRLPLPEYQPFDFALFGGLDVGTANTAEDGMWLHEPEYINKIDLTA